MAVVYGTASTAGGARQRQPSSSSLPVPQIRKSPSHNNLTRRLELELSPNFGRPDGPQTMSFVSIGDITTFAERVERLYEYGWSSVSNPCASPTMRLVQDTLLAHA